MLSSKEQQFDIAKQVIEGAKKQGVAGEKLNVLEAQLSPKTQKPPLGASPPQELINKLLEHYQSGRFAEAETLSVRVTQGASQASVCLESLKRYIGPNRQIFLKLQRLTSSDCIISSRS